MAMRVTNHTLNIIPITKEAAGRLRFYVLGDVHCGLGASADRTEETDERYEG